MIGTEGKTVRRMAHEHATMPTQGRRTVENVPEMPDAGETKGAT